jgi:hypothetical protein
LRKIALIFLLLLIICKSSVSQIILYERLPNSDLRNNENIFTSSKRIKLELNGIWQAKFDDKKSVSLNIPFCTDFSNDIFLEKQISIPDSVLLKYNFIFYSEGINYLSEVKINDVIVSRNSGGGKLIFTEIQDNILHNNNSIVIRISNNTDDNSSYPLANQVNYSKNYSGILANIALYAVPRIYLSDIVSGYVCESANSINFRNQVKVNTFNIDTIVSANASFFVMTELIRKSDSLKVYESQRYKIEPKSYQNYSAINESVIKNIEFWSPEKPVLYYIKTFLFKENEVIDEYVAETGFVNKRISGNVLFINEQKYKLNGINYFEDQPGHGSALEYSQTEKDLQLIRLYGFNCIRVPGKSAHPFIIKIAQQIGLFVLEEIPFNETNPGLMASEKYRNGAVEYIESVIKRDKNSPAVLFWGIGNNFDVTGSFSALYAKEVLEKVLTLDDRGFYYSTRTFNGDQTKKVIKITGLNIIGTDISKFKDESAELDRNNFNIITSFGIPIVNSNRNGFGDKNSEEYQAKFLTDFYNEIKNFPISFISSFADYYSEHPILNGKNENLYFRTDGIFTYKREPKYAAEVIKRYLNNQGFQKIPEGNTISESTLSYNLITVVSIIVLIFFILTVSKSRYLKDNLIKCVFTPKNFYYTLRELAPITLFQNILIIFYLCLTVGLFSGSILFFLINNPDFDLILSKVIANGSVKELFIMILRNPAYLIIFTTLSALLTFLSCVISAKVIFLSGKKYKRTRNLVTVITWTFVPLLLLLPASIFLGRILEKNQIFMKYSLLFFALLLAFTFLKLIYGVKNVFELNPFRAYLSGSLLLFLVAGLLYFYFGVYKSMFEIIKLIESYS